MKCCKNDYLRGRALPRFRDTGAVPVRYTLDGVTYTGIPAEFGPRAETRRIDTNTYFSVITGRTPAGLELRAECTEYVDYPVTEWVMYITNASSVNSAVISEFCVTAELPAKGGARLYHGNGDNCTPSGYSWSTDELGV
jgi:hypothetical protein